MEIDCRFMIQSADIIHPDGRVEPAILTDVPAAPILEAQTVQVTELSMMKVPNLVVEKELK